MFSWYPPTKKKSNQSRKLRYIYHITVSDILENSLQLRSDFQHGFRGLKMCFNPIICISWCISVWVHLIINQAMVILTKDQRIVLAWVKFLIISYIISIAYIIQYTSYQLYHISQYTKDSTCLGVVPNHILYHTKGLAPFTYTVKLWKSWGHWPS